MKTKFDYRKGYFLHYLSSFGSEQYNLFMYLAWKSMKIIADTTALHCNRRRLHLNSGQTFLFSGNFYNDFCLTFASSARQGFKNWICNFTTTLSVSAGCGAEKFLFVFPFFCANEKQFHLKQLSPRIAWKRRAYRFVTLDSSTIFSIVIGVEAAGTEAKNNECAVFCRCPL